MILLGLQVTANEEMDPAVLVRMLQQEVKDLKQEIRCEKACTSASASCVTVPSPLKTCMLVNEDGRPDLLCRLLKASQDGAGGALTAQHYTDLSTAMASIPC